MGAREGALLQGVLQQGLGGAPGGRVSRKQDRWLWAAGEVRDDSVLLAAAPVGANEKRRKTSLGAVATSR